MAVPWIIDDTGRCSMYGIFIYVSDGLSITFPCDFSAKFMIFIESKVGVTVRLSGVSNPHFLP